ncbi:MAG: hypothetical protein KKD21_15830 [Proteobacteria bacterium]|nr:hypothetical protein [Pseudomonadota bacterium]
MIESLAAEGIIPKDGEFEKRQVFWEDQKTITLILYSREGKPYSFKFGKRAPFHYKCDLGGECFRKGQRRFILENEMWVLGRKVPSYSLNDLCNFFINRETVVIEEKEVRINFYSGLKKSEKNKKLKLPFGRKIAVQISRADVECPRPHYKQTRPCAEHPRVSYVTHRPPELTIAEKPRPSSYYEEGWLYK